MYRIFIEISENHNRNSGTDSIKFKNLNAIRCDIFNKISGLMLSFKCKSHLNISIS